MSALRLIAVAVVLACSTVAAWAQAFGNSHGIGNKKDKAPPVMSDIKYIYCEVCEAVAREAHGSVAAARAANRNLQEFDVIEIVEKMCGADVDGGKWITQLDMIEDGDAIRVVQQDSPGKCGTECRTIEKACERILEGADTDLAELLFSHGDKSVSEVVEALCSSGDMSDACTRKARKVPASRSPGPAFEPMTAEEVQLAEMMAKMEAMGLSGNMMDREAAAHMADGFGDDYDEDDLDAMERYAEQLEAENPPPEEDAADAEHDLKDEL